MRKTIKKISNRVSYTTLLLSLFAQKAFAAGQGGADSMPWENGLLKLSASLQGRTAYFIVVIGFVVAAAAYVFSGELTGVAKFLVRMIMAGSILLSVGVLMNLFFGVQGAAIF